MGEAKFTPVSMGGSQVGMNKDVKYIPALPEGLSSAGWMLKNKSKYVPVFADASSLGGKAGYYSPSNIIPNITDKKEYTLDWWTENAIFRYDALLVSAFYGLDNWDFREFYNIPRKNFMFVADSGGYQAESQGVYIKAEDALAWMEHNADVGMTLDFPAEVPQNYAESSVMTAEWRRSMEKSRRSYEIMHRNRKSEDLTLLKVIHGDSIDHIEMWWDYMKDLQFDGISVSPTPVSEKGIAYHLSEAILHDEKICHCFLGTGMSTLPVHIYAKKYFDLLTFDSASFSLQGAKFRSFCLPMNPGKSIDFGASYKSTFKRLPCSCPVCRISTPEVMNINIVTESDNYRRSVPGGLLALHNLHAWLAYIDFLDALSDSRDDYFAFVKAEGYVDAIKAMNFIDMAVEKGIKEAQTEIYEEDSGRNLDTQFV